jgi:hypothetical protein
VKRSPHSAVMAIVAALMAIAYTPRLIAAPAPAQANPAAPTACSLLSKEIAATALGEAVKGPDATNLPNGKSACEYTGSGLHKVHLNVMPLTPDTAAIYKGLCAQKGKEGLTGLGDVTCWYSAKHEELQVLKGGTFFSIELRKSGDPTEAIKGVAKKVFDQLK